jgi:arsenate reductase
VTEINLVDPGTQRALHKIARDLQHRYEGVFGEETIRALLEDSYLSLAATATVTRWLVLSTERFAQQRLEALVHAENRATDRTPGVLFLCVHNAGRSQMALGMFHDRAQGRAVAWSGGSHPVSEINPAAVAAMEEIGIDITSEFPKPWTTEFLDAADVVVSMGCGDSCPLVSGKHYEDWELDDPTDKTIEEVRPIRNEIGRHVDQLLERLGILTT